MTIARAIFLRRAEAPTMMPRGRVIAAKDVAYHFFVVARPDRF
jgi:hypothetical protein